MKNKNMNFIYKDFNSIGKGWVITFEDKSYVDIVRHFEFEIQAVVFLNFLNGGTIDIQLIKDLLVESDKFQKKLEGKEE